MDLQLGGRRAIVTGASRGIGKVADTGDDDAVHIIIAGAVEALGGIDILVNNAATASGQSRPAKVTSSAPTTS